MVRKARQDLELTQLCVAAELGMSSSQPISEMERGRRPVPIKYVDRMTEILGLDKRVVLELILQAGSRRRTG